MAWGPLSGSSSQVIVSAGAAALTYEGAYINGSEAGASNSTIGLKFTEAVPTGSDYTTGMTIEVTADNGSSYETLNLSSTTQAVVDTNYVQYTLTGTVDTFQGLDGTTGHQVKISYDGSQSWNSNTITNITTLTNASTVNLLDLFTHGYDMDEASGVDRADAIGSLNFSDVNDVTQQDGVSTATVKSAGFTRSSYMRLTHADNAAFDNDNTEYFGWMAWVRFTEDDATEFIIAKQAGGSAADWTIMYHGSVLQQFKWGISPASASNEQNNWATRYSPVLVDTWYMIAGWFDPTVDGTDTYSYVNVTQEDEEINFVVGTGAGDGTQRLTIPAAHQPTPSTAAIEFGSVNGGSNYLDGRVDAAYWFKGTSGPSNDEISDFFNGGNGKQWPFLPDYT